MHEYLGLEGGPPKFRQDFTCPALLWDNVEEFAYGAVTLVASLSREFRSLLTLPLAWSPFARRY